MPRFWGADEADAALPRLAELVQRVRDGAVTPQVAAEALAADGILLRDPVRGLVDFTAVAASGRPYWLCWVFGDPTVAFWHWPEDGFAGRRSLDQPPD